MLTIYKKSKSEPVYKCECGVTWKNSWLDPHQLDNTCPACQRNLDTMVVEVHKMEEDKHKSSLRIPPNVKLHIAYNNVRTAMEEKYHQLETTMSDRKATNIKIEIENLRDKLQSLREQIHKLDKKSGTNKQKVVS